MVCQQGFGGSRENLFSADAAPLPQGLINENEKNCETLETNLRIEQQEKLER